MTLSPPLLHGRRRGLAAALVALAMGEALLVVLFAARLDHLLSGVAPTLATLAFAIGLAAAAAAALLAQRWVGEFFAQAFVADCRASIFAALARRRSTAEGVVAESRWLTALINDMASLRNYALRGTVRLWTNATAAGAASLWVAAAIPQLRIGLVALGLGTAAIFLLTVPLSHAILDQRRVRGRLNRFMVRRVQADARRGHGFRKLASLSDDLSRTAVRRAARVGAMEAAATLSGLLAALLLVRQASGPAGATGIAGHLTLIAFIAARQLESARALQARIAGRIALDRLAGLIASAPPPRRARSTNRLPPTASMSARSQAGPCRANPIPNAEICPVAGALRMIAQREPNLKPALSQPRFRPAPAKGIPGCFIANVQPGHNVLVAVHGISRNAAEIALRFANDPAFAKTTIIAPLFDRKGFGQYQQLQARKPGQTAADAALIALLDDIAAEHGIATGRFALFGFSGGAQMAHRFAMFHPEQVARLCVVSAGWYSMPHTDIAYPYGIGDGKGSAIAGAGFLDIPTTVVVGNRDTRIDASVRQEEIINLHQGRNRLRRARCYTRAFSAYARNHGKDSAPALLTLPGMSHDFNQCVTEGGLLAVAARALL